MIENHLDSIVDLELDWRVVRKMMKMVRRRQRKSDLWTPEDSCRLVMKEELREEEEKTEKTKKTKN